MHQALLCRNVIPQSCSPLLYLPGELRNQILGYVVSQSESIELYNLQGVFDIDVRVKYVCRQLRDEVRSVLYYGNTLMVRIDNTGTPTSLSFSRHHSICDFSASEAVEDIISIFLQRFSRLRFCFTYIRNPRSLHRALSTTKHYFNGKYISIVLPLSRALHQKVVLPSLYYWIRVLLSCFSIIRCASLSVVSIVSNYDLTQHDKLIELVTSNKPVLDMHQEYVDAHCSVSNVVK